MRFAVIPAAGSGRRFGGKKQFFKVKNRSILEHAICPFQKSELIHGIVLVLPSEDIGEGEKLAEKFPKIVEIVPGGVERQGSVYRGLKALENKNVKEVVIHDGVRPVIDTSLIRELIIALSDYDVDGVIPGVRPKETVKELGAVLEPGDHLVKRTLNRDKLILVQTPQVFSYSVLVECHERARKEELEVTDDATLLEHYGYTVVSIPGDYRNIKVTTREDFEVVKILLKDVTC